MKIVFTCAVVIAAMAVGPAAFAATKNSRAKALFVASANDRQAFIKLEAAAKAGDPAAEDWLGLDYESGFSKGLAQSYRVARVWFEKAAKQGYANADYNLGQLYQVGAGVPRSFSRARYWYRRAAARGSVEGRISLNVLAKLAQ